MKKIVLVILPLAILAGGWFLFQPEKRSGVPTAVTPEKLTQDTSRVTASDIKSSQTDHTLAETQATIESTAVSTQTEPAFADNTSYDNEASTIAVTALSDQQFNNIQNRLRNEPEFLASLLTEFRYNTDHERGKRLAALLGDLNHPDIVQAAAELAYSGAPDSQRIGLDLLSRLQPHNSQARDIAIELLGSETSADLLVSTMNALATPTRNASNQQRVQLIDTLNLLTDHHNPQVRSHSISLLGRWNPGASTTILTQGLNDQDAAVRARSAAAFIGKNNADINAIYGLLAVAENTQEIKTTRQSALYALQKMQLTSDAKVRYEQAIITVRRTRQ